MHPFIPFVTEEIWLKNKLDKSNKNFLMLTNWTSGKYKKDNDYKEVEKIYPSMQSPKLMIPKLKELIRKKSI